MDIWSTLGIEPTADLLVIKKAYAARLKRTRPEDDAAAYQALRDAYELAQQHARQAAAQAVPERTGPAEAQVSEPPAMAPLPGGDAGQPPLRPAAAEPQGTPTRQVPQPPGCPQEVAAPDHIAPGELAHSTLRYLRSAGPKALMAGWPILRSELDKLPLSERAEACNWFAQLVIDTPDMPLEYAKALSGYFGWETDFRAVQWMGPQRAEALREQLVNLGQAPHVEEAFRRHYFEIEYYGQLVSVLAKWRLYLFTILAPGRIARLWSELEPGLRYALGVPKPPLHTLAERAMEMGGLVRSLLVIVLAAVLAAGDRSAIVWPLRFMLAGFAVFGGMQLIRWVHGVLFSFKLKVHSLAGPHWLVPGQSLPWGTAWSRAHVLAAVAFACMLLATLVCAAVESKLWPVASSGSGLEQALVVAVFVLVLVAYYLPAIPATAATPVLPAILLLCVLATRAWPWFDRLPVTAVCAGATWFMACCLAHSLYGNAIEAAWYAFKEKTFPERLRPGLRPSALQQCLGILLGGARTTVGLPYRLMASGAAQSPRFAAAIILVSFIALPEKYRALQVPVTLGALLLAEWFCRTCFQNAIEALVPQPRYRAWRGWLGLGLLAAWALWALVYSTQETWVSALAGWPPSASPGESLLRLFVMVFCLPMVLVMVDHFFPGEVRLARAAD